MKHFNLLNLLFGKVMNLVNSIRPIKIHATSIQIIH